MPRTIPNALVVTAPLTEVRPGRRLSVAVHEPAQANGVTLFFCHGAGGSKNQWRAQWVAFAESGCRLVAWDGMGHGQSPQPRRREAYDGAGLVEDYLALFAAHRGQRNILIGHSYGTRLTLAALLRLAPGDVESALLLGAPPPVFAGRAGPLASWPLPLLILMRPMLSAGFAKTAWAAAADPALIAFEQNETKRNSLFMMQSLMRGAAALDVAALQRLALPIRIVAGDEDQLTPPAGGEAMAQALPNASFTVLRGCGHQIMLEKPDETDGFIRAALTGAPLAEGAGA